MTWLKLEAVAGLKFAEENLVPDDMKSDSLGCL